MMDEQFPITDIPALRLLANAPLLCEVVRRANAYSLPAVDPCFTPYNGDPFYPAIEYDATVDLNLMQLQANSMPSYKDPMLEWLLSSEEERK
jgi:hypothetical protein